MVAQVTSRHVARVWRRWRLRLGVVVFCLTAIAVIFITNSYLTERFTETTRNRAEVRLTIYAGNLLSELQRNSIVPQLLARDRELIGALESSDYSRSTMRLLTFVDEIGAASIMLFDKDGRIVAATDRNRLGENHRSAPYFVDAQRSSSTIFTSYQLDAGGDIHSSTRAPSPKAAGLLA